MAERLALPTSVRGVAGSNPAGGEILPEPKRRFIAQSLSCSSFHRLEVTEILLKGRKTLTHPSIQFNCTICANYSKDDMCYIPKAAFPRAKFLCHISHALQSLLTDFCGIITVNLYSRTDTDEKWINNNYNFGINDYRACNLWQRKFGRVLEP